MKARHTVGKIIQIIVLGAVLVFLFGCERRAVTYEGKAMSPAIRPGEVIEVDEGAYELGQPKRWDIVAFDAPAPHKGIWFFRVVAYPGEVVSFDGSGLIIDGQAPKMPPAVKSINYQLEPPRRPANAPQMPYKVPTNSYFVLGDNSPNANDSRSWGSVSREKIRGKVVGKEAQ